MKTLWHVIVLAAFSSKHCNHLFHKSKNKTMKMYIIRNCSSWRYVQWMNTFATAVSKASILSWHLQTVVASNIKWHLHSADTRVQTRNPKTSCSQYEMHVNSFPPIDKYSHEILYQNNWWRLHLPKPLITIVIIVVFLDARWPHFCMLCHLHLGFNYTAMQWNHLSASFFYAINAIK